MNLLAIRREKRFLPRIQELSELYGEEESREEWQLSQLNHLWGRYIKDLPYIASAVRRGEYPMKFSSLLEFTSTLPVVSRRDLAGRLETSSIVGPKQDVYRTTGGSTSEPISLPAWKTEFEHVAPSQWLGRYWHGVLPSDRLFLLWGHSHLLGIGWRGKLNGYKRRLYDSLLGYCRASAYDLSEAALQDAGDKLIQFKPAYVYGYSVALDQFARANRSRTEAFHSLKLKCVQATAERFPTPESRRIIEEVFGCPIVMEYGAMETGQIAAVGPNKCDYQVYWRDNLVEAIRQGDGSHKILVTSLFPRATPLIRYELGDTIQLKDASANQGHVISLSDFLDVGGRCNYGIQLEDGTFFHSEVFTHCVRDHHIIEAFQIVKESEKIEVHYIAERELLKEEVNASRSRFSKVDLRLRKVEMHRVDELEKSVSGKTPMIITR